jgi:hypothetical protein
MSFRLIYFKRPLWVWIILLGLGSCSKKDLSVPDSSTASFENFNLFPGLDKTQMDLDKRWISVRVPDSVLSGNPLTAHFTISPGASLSLNGVSQQSGITKNNFENELNYTLTAADQHTTQVWIVQATNNDNSLSWGMGQFKKSSISENRSYNWYIDQSTSGSYALVNCGPSSVTMAIKWADSSFSKTAQDARQTYETGGGWWFTTDIDLYLYKYNIQHAIIGLSNEFDSTQMILTHLLDNHQIIILCLDMDAVRSAASPAYRVDKFYPTTPGWGHFIVLKGYQKVDEKIFFETYDPYSFAAVNPDNTLKGMNRFYRSEDLARATLAWWNFAFVVAKKGADLDAKTANRKLNPAHVPVAHNF